MLEQILNLPTTVKKKQQPSRTQLQLLVKEPNNNGKTTVYQVEQEQTIEEWFYQTMCKPTASNEEKKQHDQEQEQGSGSKNKSKKWNKSRNSKWWEDIAYSITQHYKLRVGTRDINPTKTFEENRIGNDDLLVIEPLLKGGIPIPNPMEGECKGKGKVKRKGVSSPNTEHQHR